MTDSSEEAKSGQYIGPNKVFGLQREDFTTPSGGEVVRVLFETMPPRIMPLTAFNLLVTEKPIDYTTLGDKKNDAIINGMVNIMMEYDPTALEVETILVELSSRISNMFDKAGHVALTKELYGRADLENWTPGTNFTHYRTMVECDSLVRRAMKENEPTKSTEGEIPKE